MGIPTMAPSSETLSFCVCPSWNICLHNDLFECMPNTGFCISLSRVQLIMPDLTLGWSVKCQLSVCDKACLFDRELVSLLLFQTLQFLRTCLYMFTAAILLSLAPIKKTHTSWQFIMWSPCHVLHLHQLFLFVMDWTWAFLHFSKCPCRRCERRILTMWAITCQCSGEQPALDRFRSGNSLDDKEHRRSTRWLTPAHFLFKSVSTPGSCKLFPVRKGLPVVLCWL